MEELYRSIEEKIKAAGYQGHADGKEIYNEICDQIEDKENGTYLFLSKKDDAVCFEYKITVMDDDFNLSYLRINTSDQIFFVDFDD